MDYIEQRIYLPTGCDPDDINASAFAVQVLWRGKGKWAVAQGLGFPAHRFLSSAGKWALLPPPMHHRHYRFDFATACAMAERYVETVVINGRTWAEWEASDE